MQDHTPRLLCTLMTVPHLANTCVEHRVLTELRSVCPEARLWATCLFTGLTVDLDQPLSQLFTGNEELSSMLAKCQLRRLCVVINLEHYRELTLVERSAMTMDCDLYMSRSKVYSQMGRWLCTHELVCLVLSRSLKHPCIGQY